jgi:hypothetical protein
VNLLIIHCIHLWDFHICTINENLNPKLKKEKKKIKFSLGKIYNMYVYIYKYVFGEKRYT